MQYDYVIKNVKVYDGSGKAPYVSDVLIKGDKIADIGKDLTARDVIDGSGLCLAPGFIDVHTHSDAQLFSTPDRAYKLKMGVTSEIGGLCGGSRAPFASFMPKVAREFLDNTSNNPSMITCFETFEEFENAVNELGVGAHQKSFTGHRMIRGSVVGMEDRPMTAKELDTACGLMDEAMSMGSMGFSTGLVYAPSIYGTTDELIEICKVVSKYGGMYNTHMRSEGGQLLEAVEEAINIAKKADVKLNISHLKAMFPQNYYKAEKAVEMIDKANAEGMDITFDVYPYTASSASILSTLPPSYNSHGLDWLVEHLTGEENVEKLRKAIYEQTEKWENPMKNIGPENMLIVKAEKTPEIVGKNIAQIAEDRGIDHIAAYAAIIAENRGMIYDVRFSMSEDTIAMLYKHPKCMVGTDGLYTAGQALSHPRHFGTFPRYLGRFVRDRGILPFEEGIRRITSMSAERYGFENKGYIKKGYDADLVLFDENTILDHSDYLTPFEPNDGVKAVFVMGGIAVKDNVYTGLKNGKFYKR